MVLGDKAVEVVVARSGDVAAFWTTLAGAPIDPGQIVAPALVVKVDDRPQTVALHTSGDALVGHLEVGAQAELDVSLPSVSVGGAVYFGAEAPRVAVVTSIPGILFAVPTVRPVAPALIIAHAAPPPARPTVVIARPAMPTVVIAPPAPPPTTVVVVERGEEDHGRQGRGHGHDDDRGGRDGHDNDDDHGGGRGHDNGNRGRALGHDESGQGHGRGH